MTRLKLTDYLGAPVAKLMVQRPFSTWSYSRTIESDLASPEIRYVFDSQPFEIICDGSERISAIFLHQGANEQLSPVPMRSARHEVAERLGVPTKSGAALRDPILGHQGPWDRFESNSQTIHVQYQVDADEICLVTLIRPDMVPE